MVFYPMYYDIISLTNLIITQAFIYYLVLQIVFYDFKIQNYFRLAKGSGSDNGGSLYKRILT